MLVETVFFFYALVLLSTYTYYNYDPNTKLCVACACVGRVIPFAAMEPEMLGIWFFGWLTGWKLFVSLLQGSPSEKVIWLHIIVSLRNPFEPRSLFYPYYLGKKFICHFGDVCLILFVFFLSHHENMPV